MDARDLMAHVASGEGLMTEFKRCRTTPEHDTFETICSFANHQGGNLFLGVDDDGSISGMPVRAARNIQRSIVNVISNPNQFNVAPVVEMESVEVNGQTVVRVWVPAGPAVYAYKGVTYDRIADADVKVVGVEQKSLLYLRKQNEYSERRVYPYVAIAVSRRRCRMEISSMLRSHLRRYRLRTATWAPSKLFKCCSLVTGTYPQLTLHNT